MKPNKDNGFQRSRLPTIERVNRAFDLRFLHTAGGGGLKKSIKTRVLTTHPVLHFAIIHQLFAIIYQCLIFLIFFDFSPGNQTFFKRNQTTFHSLYGRAQGS